MTDTAQPAPQPQDDPAADSTRSQSSPVQPRGLHGLPVASETLGDRIDRLNRLADRWETEAQEYSDQNLSAKAVRVCARQLRQALADQPIPGLELPLELAVIVVQAGPVRWAITEPLDARQHAEMVAENFRITAERFGQGDEPQPTHWLAVQDGSDAALAMVGTSPNSGQIARGLAGAWNQLVELARRRLELAEADQ